ncbi:hypothetical protein OG474_18150 [Kribbella sp. NBC_01505]|uniref:hypothetical protein n=1 Tax=Kribbella sp. NBC_01505 TaxID=2903580 RepID=UPI003864011E
MSQATTRKVAIIAFTTNLVVCALVGTGLLLVRAPSGSANTAVPTPSPTTPTSSTSSTPGPSETPSTTPSATPTSSPTPTSPYKDAFGPGGIGTKIPSGWTGKVRSGKTDAQATDPAQPTSFLRYGGSPSPAQPLIDVMRNAERNFSTQYPGYKLITLQPNTWREHEAVNWTFEFDTADGRKHVDSVYWRAGQNDYVIYASALAKNWPTMQEIYQTAHDAAAP